MPVLLAVANRVAPAQVEDVRTLLRGQLPAEILLAVLPEDANPASVIPEDANLLHPHHGGEIQAELGGEVLFGEAGLGNQVDNYVIGAMQVPNFLNYLKGERTDSDARRPGRHHPVRLAGQCVVQLPARGGHRAHRRHGAG